jgi:membrane-associated phospholipid phosphatase
MTSRGFSRDEGGGSSRFARFAKVSHSQTFVLVQDPIAAQSAAKTSMRRVSFWLSVLLAACVVWASFELDEPVRKAVVQTQVKGWKKSDDYRFKTGVRRFGDWPGLMLAASAGIAIAWKLKRREWIRILVAAMIASTVAGAIANTSRVTTGRTRPRETPKIQQGFYGPWKDGRLTIGDPAFNSFPSGHTATAFGFAGVILFARFWLGIGAIALASLIAWSSIMVGAHHPSDVIVAICLALFIAWFTLKWTEENGEAFAHTLWMKFRAMKKGRPKPT